MIAGAGLPDPFLLSDTVTIAGNIHNGIHSYRNTTGRQRRSQVINPAQRTGILFGVGQSFYSSVMPTLVVPANAANIDNANVHDGGFYDIVGPLLGTTYALSLAPTLGPGNALVLLADMLIANGKFDRVIIYSLSIGNTNMESHGNDDGLYADRFPVAMRRLASRGIVPGTPNLTMMMILSDGTRDYVDGTSQAVFAAAGTKFLSKVFATGFDGKVMICHESLAGQTSNAIRSAQTSLINGVNTYYGGDIDSTAITRTDGTHPDNAGGLVMATANYNNMQAAGVFV
ncbi:MAG: hypothetical protein PS018_11505 [bacterium]|nr:hypothetical protein [bacterium]